MDGFLRFGLILFFSTGALLYLVQIGLRISHRSVLWLDPLLQYLFVMAALFGASFAVKTGESIKIDIFRKLSRMRALRVALNLIAALISVFITVAFVQRMQHDLARAEVSDFIVARWVLNLPYILLFAFSAVYYGGRAVFPALDVDAEGHGADHHAKAEPKRGEETP
jgi:TRAP-type C4-dicarboxylate transport system permease small subunit